jgi:hypothetical protein
VDTVVGRKWKRNNNQNSCCAVHRIDDDEDETTFPSDLFLQLPTAVELRRVWGWMYLILIFLGGTLDLDLDIGISLVEIRDRISGEQRQASIKGSPKPLASKGIWINIIMSVLYSTKIG